MPQTTSKLDRDQAAEAPPLPNGIIRFVMYCVASFKGWIVLMLFFELGQATGNILVPYAVKKIMDGVTSPVSSGSLWANLEQPLLFLAALNLAEIVFSRASGAVLITMGPRLRQHTAKSLYAYLQYHSPRFFSEHFAGALAHRITETAVSINHTLWAVICDFWPIIISFGVSITLLFGVHRDLGQFVAGWVLMYVLASYWLATRCQPYAQNYAAMRSLVNG
jgi:ATP-binding cassette subfamily B protein